MKECGTKVASVFSFSGSVKKHTGRNSTYCIGLIDKVGDVSEDDGWTLFLGTLGLDRRDMNSDSTAKDFCHDVRRSC